MFTADAIIDTIQTGKKTFVNTVVTNEAVKTALIDFVEAQGEYTKKAAKVGQDTFSRIATESVKQYQEMAKFDYNKFLDAFKTAKK
jgi:hypothetical protein